MQLTPIKVIIKLKTDGSALYPDFGSLQIVRDSGLDWSIYIDNQGTGWLYDCCGHKESNPDSPIGSQLGMILVPSVFATQAIETFPNTVSKLTEAEAEDFYNTKHAKDFQDEEINQDIVSGIQAKKSLQLPLTDIQIAAIDPTNDTPGIRANWRKTFDTFKTKRGITIAK